MQQYDRSTKMLLDLELGPKRHNHEEVTSIIGKLTDRKDMPALNVEDEKWADMSRSAVFVDDVKSGNELVKQMERPKSKAKKQGGKIISSTRRIDTDKG